MPRGNLPAGDAICDPFNSIMRPRIRRLRWRDYQTAAGIRPLKAFLDRLTDEQAAAVVAAMKEVAHNGLAAARHLRGEVYEVRAEAERQAFRVLVGHETTFILLALSGFQKKRAKTPPDEIALAESRLADWRRRGRRSEP
jgi:phage-related protein